MGMIAVLTLISVAALLSSQTQNMVDSMTQNILSNIRDAQNRSVSTTPGTSVATAKVWAYQVGPVTATDTANSLYTYSNISGIGLDAKPEATNTAFNSAAKISITKDGVSYGNTANIAFASPFGMVYISDGSNYGACAWKTKDTRPAQDWFIESNSGCGSLISPTQNSDSQLEITVTYKTISRKVIVRANGDSHIE